MDVLTEQLAAINQKAKPAALEEAIHKITTIEHGTLIWKNKIFTDWLQNGLEVSYQEKGETRTGIINLVDFKNPSNNAIFIGFTGTPIAKADKNTREVFGDYIDIYDMTQSVEDGATKPVYYENRVINLGLKEDILKKIDETYELLAQNACEKDIEKSKKELGNMEAILGAPETIISSLCNDIIEHYEKYRANLLTGKAMVACYSRPIAMRVCRKFLELCPEWTEKVKVVMTIGNNAPEEWWEIIGNKTYKKELAKKFKDDNDPMKIAIVVDMWLTGFDVPSLATMYVFKLMLGHNLTRGKTKALPRKKRCKQAGMRWNEGNAQELVTLKAKEESGSWGVSVRDFIMAA
jgi:type I restriction enzyme R subunit